MHYTQKMADCGAIPCDEIGQNGPLTILRRIIRMGADGCPAVSLAAVAVTDPCAEFFTCGPDGGVRPVIGWMQLLGLLTGLNAEGCFSIRTVLSGGNCRLQDLDNGEIHCNDQYLVNLNPFGDMTYLGYHYIYEYSMDGGLTWVVFGGNTNLQLIGDLPGFGTPGLYIFRAKIHCTIDDPFFRTVYFAQGTPFARFMQVSVNGGAPRVLKTTAQGINYFCKGDTLRFIQSNTQYTASVNGPGAFDWNSDDQTWVPSDNLPDGVYDATFTDLSGVNCSGGKAFEIVIMPKPVITGDLALCFGETTVLDAGAGYDSYLWNTGATTQTIAVGAAGNYSVTVRRTNTPGCALSSDPVTVTMAPPLDPIVTSKGGTDAACVIRSSNVLYSAIVGDVWNLQVQDYGVGATYDFGFGPGPDPFMEVNGPGVFNITVTLNGCSTTLDVTVNGVENNTIHVISQLSSSPCCKRVNLTDPEVIQANVVFDVYGNVSGLIGSFTNQLIIDFCLDPADTAWSAILSGTGTTGCSKVLLLIDQPAC